MPVSASTIVLGALAWIGTKGTGWWEALGFEGWGGTEGRGTMVQMDVAFEPWNDEQGAPECEWYNGSFKWTLGPLCTHFSISRVGPSALALATDRALQCASRVGAGCVLAPEVGVGLPALFVYTDTGGMRALLAPRLLADDEIESAAAAADALDEAGRPRRVNVRVDDPSGRGEAATLTMRTAVVAEFLTGGSRKLHVETLVGDDAFCVQLARHAIAQECWDALE